MSCSTEENLKDSLTLKTRYFKPLTLCPVWSCTRNTLCQLPVCCQNSLCKRTSHFPCQCATYLKPLVIHYMQGKALPQESTCGPACFYLTRQTHFVSQTLPTTLDSLEWLVCLLLFFSFSEGIWVCLCVCNIQSEHRLFFYRHCIYGVTHFCLFYSFLSKYACCTCTVWIKC